MAKTWLIGAGLMAEAYMKVLSDLQAEVTVIGRGVESARRFEDATGVKVVDGGFGRFLADSPQLPEAAIVSVGVPELVATMEMLLRSGCRHILLEKPGGVDLEELESLKAMVNDTSATVVLAYNRRFYESTRIARQMIVEDGGPSSFHFEFTEWNHVIENLDKPKIIFDNWLLANSSHVIDLAFFLGGAPVTLYCRTGGYLAWHPDGAVFCGVGQTQSGALFSYHANWCAPGRWGVEILTNKRRYILRPLEKLQIQEIGSVAIKELPLNDRLDLDFKPGLHLQVENFLCGRLDDFNDLNAQIKLARLCDIIAGRQKNCADSVI